MTLVDTPNDQESIRVLHAVGKMDRAGIETWLMQVLRAIGRDRYSFDFLVDDPLPGAFDDEIRSLGCQVLCVGSRRDRKFSGRVQQLISDQRGYDVVHGHLNYFNGRLLRAAEKAGVPIRIAHSHTDKTASERQAGLVRRLGATMLRGLIHRHATSGIAVSKQAAVSMFGRHWQLQTRCKVMPCGVDFRPFATGMEDPQESNAFRSQWNIPKDAWVIGHVGRMVELKNHRLLIETLREITSIVDDAHLLLVGDGPLYAEIERHVGKLGLSDRVHFAGLRDDIPLVLTKGMDVFLFPSKLEGLGVSLIEAQAAGLPCIVSDVVPREPDIVPSLITRLSVTNPGESDTTVSESWANATIATRQSNRDRKGSLALAQASGFSIDRNVSYLQQLYRGKLKDGSANG